MKKKLWHLLNTLYFIALFFGCDSPDSALPERSLITIYGRDRGSAIYQMNIPSNWIPISPDPSISIQDTKKPIYEFIIPNGEEQVEITIHNFPSHSLQERIPTMAQVTRWREQFSELDETRSFVIPQAFGGYAGYRFEGSGKMENSDTTVIAWAMQLPTEHYYSLSFPTKKISSEERDQMKADYTIKFVGPTNLILEHKNTINAAARSFRLIKEIPKGI